MGTRGYWWWSARQVAASRRSCAPVSCPGWARTGHAGPSSLRSGRATPLSALRLAFSKAFDKAEVEVGRRPSWLAPDAYAVALPPLRVVADQYRQATVHHEASVLISVDQAEELIQGADSEEVSTFLAA